ncbi:MAG: hypothetical protein ACM3JK_03055, partial [Betaproteobacteria bacterium]
MLHTVAYNSDLGIVEIKFHENVTWEEVREILWQSAQVAKEQKCFLFLSDFREATLKLSTLELFGLPKILSETFASSEISTYKIKRAFVVAKDLKDYSFFET